MKKLILPALLLCGSVSAKTICVSEDANFNGCPEDTELFLRTTNLLVLGKYIKDGDTLVIKAGVRWTIDTWFFEAENIKLTTFEEKEKKND